MGEIRTFEIRNIDVKQVNDKWDKSKTRPSKILCYDGVTYHETNAWDSLVITGALRK